MSTEALKPCPFCGADAVVEETENGIGRGGSVSFSVGCNSRDEEACMGYQSLTTFSRRSEAIKAWNTRADSALAAREMIEVCAQIADNEAKAHSNAYDTAKIDPALSDSAREGMLDRLAARSRTATNIAQSIRALAIKDQP